MHPSKKVLSVFSLVMINVIAVDSLRTLPISAKLGLPLVSYYLVAAVTFFIPIALVAAELATAYPNTGGLYVWVREAFGRRAGFITIWLQWIYNVVWYPTILAFIAATLSYLFAPELANNKFYLLTTVLGLFWLFTLLNCFGMRVSSIVSIIGASLGTILPMVLVSILGALWLFQGKPLPIDMPFNWIPDFSSVGNLSLFAAVLFGLLGMEMSAVHAEEVKNPQRDYPRAILYSTILIFATLVLGSLAIVIVVPNKELSVVSGLIDAYAVFFSNYHIPWMTKVIAVLIILGGVSGVSAWIIGPTKGLLVAARDGSLPERLAKVNRHGAPVAILIAQGVIFTLLSSVFILLDSINAAYWLLSDLSAQMALLVYVFMFSAAIKLRYSQPHKHRSYTIPGGNLMMWIVAGLGILCCLTAMLIGFVPPTQIPVGNVFFFEAFLLGGLILFVVLPWFLAKKHEEVFDREHGIDSEAFDLHGSSQQKS
ncbi:APC family permease [Legionella maceachernii]|uniref:Amino acid antiporter n=2 Tax=Legionella TaxID=445 RepID=A0A0W0WBX6_9GAMM|nr:APC family permease [Legionella maceachernii]KTD29817.1 amino acid antiporter [Legionella maceachernii]SJZ78796.1 amino acid/polyamine/organocation transporter, APC superfamily (TC 2.A.3) [Legionella maceachernii]SUP02950.1 Glutamate/gamma-aminobutyrate antiporter [Legionella maceachernii]